MVFVCLGAAVMPPSDPVVGYQQRVLAEAKELREKLLKLVEFTFSNNFDKLDEENRSLLLEQRNAMFLYSDILYKRISLFKQELSDPAREHSSNIPAFRKD
jgi:hypothetical protein